MVCGDPVPLWLDVGAVFVFVVSFGFAVRSLIRAWVRSIR